MVWEHDGIAFYQNEFSYSRFRKKALKLVLVGKKTIKLGQRFYYRLSGENLNKNLIQNNKEKYSLNGV